MTLAELLKNAGIGGKNKKQSYSYVGDGNQIVEKSISKSSPAFKATQPSNAPTVPGAAPSDGFKFMARMPEQQTDFSGMPAAARGDLQGVDYFKNLAQNAERPETKQAAIAWLDRQLGGDTPTIDDTTMPETGTGDGEIDFSTPTTDVAYSMEKLNEIYGTKSPEDLWALRQKLRLQESQASAGMLPEEEYMKFQGDGITDGAPRYNYDQKMGVNRATADIFSTQVSDLDKFMSDYSKGETANGSSGYGTNPIIATLLASGKFTKDQAATIKYAIDNGESPETVIKNIAKNNMDGTLKTKTGQLESAYSQLQSIDTLLKDFYASGGKSSYFKGNMVEVANKLGAVNDPKLVEAASRLKSMIMTYRNATTGTAASVSEDANIKSIFPGIDKGEALNNALTKSRLEAVRQEIKGNYESQLPPGVFDSFDKKKDTVTPTTSSWKQNADGTWSFNQVGGGTNTAIGGLSDAMKRIARNESPSGNYKELGPVVTSGQYKGQRALGLYQVMPGNIPAWSKEALGYSITPQQFLNSPQLQEKIVAHQMTQAYKKYGNWSDVASVWFTGRPLAQGKNARDVLGTSGSEYVRRFNA